MQNFDRRLERAEKWAGQRLPPRSIHRAVELALHRLSDEQLELLLTGFPAEREHREPTESEAAALEAYRLALEEEFAKQESESAQPCVSRQNDVLEEPETKEGEKSSWTTQNETPKADGREGSVETLPAALPVVETK